MSLVEMARTVPELLAHRLVSVAEAAALTSVSEKTIRRQISRGELQARRLSAGRIGIPLKSLIDLGGD